ncbi:DNA-binding transcriptional LysR family regulator [Herbihabitans rhizosphaerae]|uniref:DNA-binding transcriptional LysR family regulator n=1 Tax=Herbihabitans rhizosphaerae TaxID=1872711 RepID=A0A4Q7KRQ2_9PSEU|nr:LysR family transcriptional regulator [Herbihabitans rhizosphaerae]RZS39245.1 DNA-binding transcriptional LysR family regulator [Herbihabitans rhizosphaerae]
MELQVRHLRVLRVIEQAGSLTKAAAELSLPQASLSHQLRRIESTVGGTIFERDHQGVRATPLGQALLARARAIVSAFDELDREFHRGPARAGQPFRIDWQSADLLGLLVDGLREIPPGKQLTGRADPWQARLLTKIVEDGIDAALLCDLAAQVPSGDGITSAPLISEPVFVAIPDTHRLADATEIQLADLADEPWILPAGLDFLGSRLRELCERDGVPMRVWVDIDAAEVREDLVAGGHGVCPTRPVRPRRNGIVVKPLVGNPLVLRHFLAWRTDGEFARHAERICDEVIRGYRRRVEEDSTFLLRPQGTRRPGAVR